MDTLKFVWLCGIPITLFLSLFLVVTFWKYEMVRLAGLYSILPAFNMIGLNLMSYPIDFKQGVIFSAVADLVFIVPIVYFFRRLYKMRLVVPWILLFFEIVRSILLLYYSVSSQEVLSYVEATFFYFYYYIPFAVLVYCVLTRSKLTGILQAPI